MVELLKLAFQKPLHALVITLCLVTSANSLHIFEVEKAVAVVQTEQLTDAEMNRQQAEMFETLIRIDENVKFIQGQMK